MSTLQKKELTDAAVDFLSDEEHMAQDAKVLDDLDADLFAKSLDDVDHENHARSLRMLVREVSWCANGGGKKYMRELAAKETAAVLQDSKIQHIVQQAWQEKKFRAIRMILQFQVKGLRKKAALDPASERAWNEPYVGQAWKVLESKVHDAINEEGSRYVRFFNVMQSSGMGKSRSIDEYSKHHFVIPLCLREDDETGFPPADSQVRDFLCPDDQSYDNSLCAAHAFLLALFQVATLYFQNIDEYLVGIPPSTSLAQKFRELMNVSHLRQAFYSKVVTKAREIKYDVTIPDNAEEEALPSAALVSALQKLLDKVEAAILLSFDEAHTLTKPLKDIPSWSSELSVRHALRGLRHQPIFSVFVSAIPRFPKPVPVAAADPSQRVQKIQLRHHKPLCALGYDHMARHFPVEGKRSLDEYATDEAMSRFGRPLFYTRWKHGDVDAQQQLVPFAAEKLLGGKALPEGQLTASQILALLSVRIPLEFNAATLDGRREGFTQVDKHMRLCITVDDVNQTCETAQPAEPLLAEAAFHIIKEKHINQASELLQVLGGPIICKGHHGELICALLWLLARDKVVQGQGKRVVKVLDLMDALLASPWHATVKDAQPSRLKNDQDNAPFRDAFKDAVTYFAQFIKVPEEQVINRSYLCMALTRGAAILRDSSQSEIDIIIPILIRNTCLARNVVSAIIIQVKNDALYGAKPDRVLFNLMNPYHIGFYDLDEQDTYPIIRMVFALGSKKSNVKVRQARKSQPSQTTKTATVPPKFTSYDIWCAMASSETFSVIDSNETCAELLKKDETFPRWYVSTVPEEENRRRQMCPMALSDPVHWQFAQAAVSVDRTVPEYNSDDDVDFEDDVDSDDDY